MAQHTTTASEMYPLVETYLAGEKTQKDFCRDHALSIAKLNYWLAKYRRETTEEPTAFLEITPDRTPTDGALLEIVYPHGVRLRLFAPLGPAYLTHLLTLDGGVSARSA